MCQLLEIDDYASFLTAKPYDDITPFVVPTDQVLTYAFSLPEIQSARLGIDIASAAYYPTLSLAASYGSSFSDARQKTLFNPDGTYRAEAYPFLAQYRDNANSYISLSLNIPIFGGLRARKNVQMQKISLRQAEYTLRTVEKQVHKEVTQAQIDARTA